MTDLCQKRSGGRDNRDIIYIRMFSQGEKALLVHCVLSEAASQKSTEEAINSQSAIFTPEEEEEELRALSLSTGVRILGEITQKFRSAKNNFIEWKNLDRIASVAKDLAPDIIVVGRDLTPRQHAKFESATGTRVVDRTQLVLDIFANHAHSKEGQLQVELTQLQYLLPRLKHMYALEHPGRVGLRGPGQTKLEQNRLHIFRRIRQLKHHLSKVADKRVQQRKLRAKNNVPLIALVGYTNAGKSTLFKALTGATVVTSSYPFSTLDPVSRPIVLPSRRKALLLDSVGFIRDLPPSLVQGFHSTLESIRTADVIVHVSDASSHARFARETAVEETLRQLGATDAPLILALNKIDLLSQKELSSLAAMDRTQSVAFISGARNLGLHDLLDGIDSRIKKDPIVRLRLRLPHCESKLLSRVEAQGRILSQSVDDNFIYMDVRIPQSVADVLREFTAN